ncbi:MAG: hypothetical protein IJO08_04365 [Clostridia bacterium]|nr:hypothetical protein [Clostridia bacterium]
MKKISIWEYIGITLERVALIAVICMMIVAIIVCSYPIFELGCMAINAVFDTNLQNPVELLAESLGINTDGGHDAIGYNGPSVVKPGFIH